MAGRSRLSFVLALLAAGSVSGCAGGPQLPRLSDMNPFAEKEKPLPGKRVPIEIAERKAGLEVSSIDKPIALPPPRQNDAWPQPGGPASNSPGHLLLGASLRQAWSADAGQGSGTKGRLTASPIVAGGRVVTLDANAHVTAFSPSGGVAWRASLIPDAEKSTQGFGGGLAADEGKLYATTGFGYAYALDLQSGKRLWEKNLGAPVRTSPTVADGRLFVITNDGNVHALSTTDGQELWLHQGLPERAALLSNASPAVEGSMVVVPFPSGDLIALDASSGQPRWNDSLARMRTTSSLGSLTDAGRPVIDGGTVYAVGHSGRMVATSLSTGERIWSLNVPGIQPPAVAGDMVYVVDTGGQLMAVTRRDGKVIWTTKLPNATTWSGPVLAGNKLWLTSNKGELVGVEASTGKAGTKLSLGAPTYIAPIVAGGRMFVLNDKARLMAFN
ncbi:MAG: PQQ-binding-like beta-propeller repeat protein [Hyphomicrobiaceae bacterium]